MKKKKNIHIKWLIFCLSFIVMGIFPISLLIYSKYRDQKQIIAVYKSNQNKLFEKIQKTIDLNYNRIFSDLEFLAQSCFLNKFLSTNSDLETLKSNWQLFSKTSGLYDQIRYIDKTGQEVIRVNYNKGTPVSVQNEFLQNKSDRYYFSMLKDLPAYTIVISPCDLNIENKEIETPIKPMIRFSLPLYDDSNNFIGAIILNYFGQILINDINSEILIDTELYILNQNKYILSGPKENQLWGFMYTDKKDYTFDKLFDVNSQLFLNSKGELFNFRNKLLRSEKIDFKSSYPKLHIIENSYSLHFMEPWWQIITIGFENTKENVYLSIIGQFWIILILYLLISLFLSILVAWQYSRRIEAEKKTTAYQNTMYKIINTLEITSSYKDDDTGNHIKRVCEYSNILSNNLGLSFDQVDLITEFASLHDIGKIGIPDNILKKPAKLTEPEWEIMKKHVLIGYNMIKKMDFHKTAEHIILYHHENWDGSGYINGLKEFQIPIEARIVSLADVYDALRSRRVYKEPFSHESATKIIKSESGKKFDPQIVAIFLEKNIDFLNISIKYSDQ